MDSLRKLIGPVIESSSKTNYLVIFLHGWGSDGNDLIQLGNIWKNQLPNATFLSPHGPEVCAGNPSGRQWFDIVDYNEDTMLSGLEKSYKDLKGFINLNIAKYQLKKNSYFLVGFSQGTMLSLYMSIREKMMGIIGYSGAFIGKPSEKISVKNDILLMHGKQDQVVPVERMYSAINSLKQVVKTINFEVYDNLEHSIKDEGLKKGFGFNKIIMGCM